MHIVLEGDWGGGGDNSQSNKKKGGAASLKIEVHVIVIFNVNSRCPFDPGERMS